MNIYLIRHGDAEGGSFSKKDFDRELTPKGKEKMKKTAEGWKNIIKDFDLIVSSPYIRAHQTAEIIAEVFNCQDKIIIDRMIGCGSRTEDVIEIANSNDVENIAFVGHQPDMSSHVSYLISGNGAFVDFEKGTIAKICFNRKAASNSGALEFLLPSDVFL